MQSTREVTVWVWIHYIIVLYVIFSTEIDNVDNQSYLPEAWRQRQCAPYPPFGPGYRKQFINIVT